jgi:hypothetical protein
VIFLSQRGSLPQYLATILVVLNLAHLVSRAGLRLRLGTALTELLLVGLFQCGTPRPSPSDDVQPARSLPR